MSDILRIFSFEYILSIFGVSNGQSKLERAFLQKRQYFELFPPNLVMVTRERSCFACSNGRDEKRNKGRLPFARSIRVGILRENIQ